MESNEEINSTGQRLFHLRRIGPQPTKPGVANIMDFYKMSNIIGRSPVQADFITDSDEFMQSKSISRCHARVVIQPGNQHRLFDDSLNGVFVNNIKIRGSCVLEEGDKVTFGHPAGSKLKPGTWIKQPNSEHQFVFEKCSCKQNKEEKNKKKSIKGHLSMEDCETEKSENDSKDQNVSKSDQSFEMNAESILKDLSEIKNLLNRSFHLRHSTTISCKNSQSSITDPKGDNSAAKIGVLSSCKNAEVQTIIDKETNESLIKAKSPDKSINITHKEIIYQRSPCKEAYAQTGTDLIDSSKKSPIKSIAIQTLNGQDNEDSDKNDGIPELSENDLQSSTSSKEVKESYNEKNRIDSYEETGGCFNTESEGTRSLNKSNEKDLQGSLSMSNVSTLGANSIKIMESSAAEDKLNTNMEIDGCINHQTEGLQTLNRCNEKDLQGSGSVANMSNYGPDSVKLMDSTDDNLGTTGRNNDASPCSNPHLQGKPEQNSHSLNDETSVDNESFVKGKGYKEAINENQVLESRNDTKFDLKENSMDREYTEEMEFEICYIKDKLNQLDEMIFSSRYSPIEQKNAEKQVNEAIIEKEYLVEHGNSHNDKPPLLLSDAKEFETVEQNSPCENKGVITGNVKKETFSLEIDAGGNSLSQENGLENPGDVGFNSIVENKESGEEKYIQNLDQQYMINHENDLYLSKVIEKPKLKRSKSEEFEYIPQKNTPSSLNNESGHKTNLSDMCIASDEKDPENCDEDVSISNDKEIVLKKHPGDSRIVAEESHLSETNLSEGESQVDFKSNENLTNSTPILASSVKNCIEMGVNEDSVLNFEGKSGTKRKLSDTSIGVHAQTKVRIKEQNSDKFMKRGSEEQKTGSSNVRNIMKNIVSKFFKFPKKRKKSYNLIPPPQSHVYLEDKEGNYRKFVLNVPVSLQRNPIENSVKELQYNGDSQNGSCQEIQSNGDLQSSSYQEEQSNEGYVIVYDRKAQLQHTQNSCPIEDQHSQNGDENKTSQLDFEIRSTIKVPDNGIQEKDNVRIKEGSKSMKMMTDVNAKGNCFGVKIQNEELTREIPDLNDQKSVHDESERMGDGESLDSESDDDDIMNTQWQNDSGSDRLNIIEKNVISIDSDKEIEEEGHARITDVHADSRCPKDKFDVSIEHSNKEIMSIGTNACDTSMTNKKDLSTSVSHAVKTKGADNVISSTEFSSHEESQERSVFLGYQTCEEHVLTKQENVIISEDKNSNESERSASGFRSTVDQCVDSKKEQIDLPVGKNENLGVDKSSYGTNPIMDRIQGKDLIGELRLNTCSDSFGSGDKNRTNDVPFDWENPVDNAENTNDCEKSKVKNDLLKKCSPSEQNNAAQDYESKDLSPLMKRDLESQIFKQTDVGDAITKSETRDNSDEAVEGTSNSEYVETCKESKRNCEKNDKKKDGFKNRVTRNVMIVMTESDYEEKEIDETMANLPCDVKNGLKNEVAEKHIPESSDNGAYDNVKKETNRFEENVPASECDSSIDYDVDAISDSIGPVNYDQPTKLFPALNDIQMSDDETKSPVYTPDYNDVIKNSRENQLAGDHLSCTFSDNDDTDFPDLDLSILNRTTEDEMEIADSDFKLSDMNGLNKDEEERRNANKDIDQGAINIIDNEKYDDTVLHDTHKVYNNMDNEKTEANVVNYEKKEDEELCYKQDDDVDMKKIDAEESDYIQSEVDVMINEQSDKENMNDDQSNSDDVNVDNTYDEQSNPDNMNNEQYGAQELNFEQSGDEDVNNEQSDGEDKNNEQSVDKDINNKQSDAEDMKYEQSYNEDISNEQSDDENINDRLTDDKDVDSLQSEVANEQRERDDDNYDSDAKFDFDDSDVEKTNIKKGPFMFDFDFDDSESENTNIENDQDEQSYNKDISNEQSDDENINDRLTDDKDVDSLQSEVANEQRERDDDNFDDSDAKFDFDDSDVEKTNIKKGPFKFDFDFDDSDVENTNIENGEDFYKFDFDDSDVENTNIENDVSSKMDETVTNNGQKANIEAISSNFYSQKGINFPCVGIKRKSDLEEYEYKKMKTEQDEGLEERCDFEPANENKIESTCPQFNKDFPVPSNDSIPLTQLISNSTLPDLDCFSATQVDNVAVKLENKVTSQSVEPATKQKARELLAKLKARRAVKQEAAECKVEIEEPIESTDDVPEDEEGDSGELQDIDSNVDRCKGVISQLKEVLDSNQTLHRVQTWRNDLTRIEKKLEFPKTIIAVVGKTGDGKSSLLNALLDQKSVLPTSCMQACTSVVVEIVQNRASDKFEADIQFLERKEWFDEVRILLNDLTGTDGKLRNRQPDQTSEVYASYCKIKAVYGKIDVFEKLARQTLVTRWLGKTKVVKSSTPEEFKKMVEKYIETQDRVSGDQFWPIVKHVRLRIPNCNVCSSGAALVDLPGIRDSNAARDKIAKEYMKNCTAIWVVSSIHRAIDDKTAKDLLGENFKRQLLMDGQYGSVTFICTKTDILAPSELIGPLNLEDRTLEYSNKIREFEGEIRDAETSVKNINREIKELEQSLKEMTQDAEELRSNLEEIGSLLDPIDLDKDESEDFSALKEYQDELKSKEASMLETQNKLTELDRCKTDASKTILELEKKISVRRKEISVICALARNQYSEDRIKSDFRSGLKEMKRRAGISNNDDDDDDDDFDDMYHDDNDAADNLKVFCCSSTEYQKIQNLLDGQSQVFTSAEDTQIPALRRYVHKIARVRKTQSLERLIRSLGGFVFDLNSYVRESKHEDSTRWKENQSAIEQEVEKLYDVLEPVIAELSADIGSVFDDNVKPKLDEGATAAMEMANDICTKWGDKKPKDKENRPNKPSSYLPYSTYKAVVTRNGEYASKTFGYINFNEDLSEPMYRCMTIAWDRAFSGTLWRVLEETKAKLVKKLIEFVEKLGATLFKQGVNKNRLRRVGAQFLGSARNKDARWNPLNEMIPMNTNNMGFDEKLNNANYFKAIQLEDMVVQLKEQITNSQREISRLVNPHIQDSLSVPYQQAYCEHGPGTYMRMKNHMSKGIDYGRFTMFDEATKILMSRLMELQESLISYTKAVVKSLIQDLRVTLEPLWNESWKSNPFSEAISPVLNTVCREMRAIYGSAGIQNTEDHSNELSEQETEPVNRFSNTEQTGPSIGTSQSCDMQISQSKVTSVVQSNDNITRNSNDCDRNQSIRSILNLSMNSSANQSKIYNVSLLNPSRVLNATKSADHIKMINGAMKNKDKPVSSDKNSCFSGEPKQKSKAGDKSMQQSTESGARKINIDVVDCFTNCQVKQEPGTSKSLSSTNIFKESEGVHPINCSKKKGKMVDKRILFKSTNTKDSQSCEPAKKKPCVPKMSLSILPLHPPVEIKQEPGATGYNSHGRVNDLGYIDLTEDN